MKKIIALFFAIAIATFSYAQELEVNMKGYGEKKLKKFPKKAYIKEFNVNFQMAADAKAVSKTTTNSRKGSSSASMSVAVTGVDVADLQEITNAVYNEFVESLKKEGFEIIPAEEMKGAKFFEDHTLLEANVNEAQNPGYLKVTPEGFKYYVKKISKKGKEQQAAVPMKLIKEYSDVLILSANYSFSSIYLTAKQNTTLGTSSVKGKVGLKMPGCSITAWGGIMTSVAFLTKKAPEFEGIFKNEGEKLKTFSMATAPTYSGFLTHTSNEFTHEAEADGDKYRMATMDTMNNFNGMALAQLFGYFGK
ncbi:hypothetical protein [Ekhidna sp.]